eukprot:12587574-Ditylum_brightwellii.AAC.1
MEQEQTHEKIIDILNNSKKRSDITRDDVLTLLVGLLNEPIVECEKRVDKSAWDYMYGIPAFLPKLLKSYKHPAETYIKIEDNPPCLRCPVIEGHNREHSFLAFKGMEQCSLCVMELYKTCCYHPKFLQSTLLLK